MRDPDRFASTRGQWFADHAVTDEAQDLHPGHWRLLRALVAEGADDPFIAEDSHRRLYGTKVVLSRYGIQVRGRSRRLTLNYRTTAQNLRFAVSILTGADVTDLEGATEGIAGYRSAMNGCPPRAHQRHPARAVASTRLTWETRTCKWSGGRGIRTHEKDHSL